jgi:tetratricopeptide (TPR) repeat protein
LFRLVGLHPGPDVSKLAAASLAGIPPNRVGTVLTALVQANLLAEHVPGRYVLHDLLRLYATELAHACDREVRRRAAIHRLLDHYLQTAYTADRLLVRGLDPPSVPPHRPGVTPEALTDQREALAWFDAEHPVLVAAVNYSATKGFAVQTGGLVWTLTNYLNRGGHWLDLADIGAVAVAAAKEVADLSAQARGESAIGRSAMQLGRFEEAHTRLQRALTLHRQAGDQVGQAVTHYQLASLWSRQSRPAQGLGHARQALTWFRAAGHRFGEARALNGLGWLYAQLGDYRHTLAYCQEALCLARELDDTLGLAGAWDSVGYAYHHLGRHARAASCFCRAIDLYRSIGARYHEAEVLVHLGDAQHITGDPAARKSWQQALTILEGLDHADADSVRARLADSPPVP